MQENIIQLKMNTDKQIEDKIDIISIIKVLWKSKRLFIKVCSIALIIGGVVSFSIPKTYKAEVVLAPELTSGMNLSGSLSDIASMVGINVGGNSSGAIDAIYPELYPEIVESIPFLTELFSVKISTKDNNLKNIELYTYIKNYQKIAWWSKIIGGLNSLFSKKENNTANKNKINNFMLNKEEDDIAQNIKQAIKCNVDKKTNLITITTITQDPLVSASLADTVRAKIQQYITNYRTKKAKNDLQYMQKLCSDAKVQYTKAQQLYSSYSDANEDVILTSFKAKQEEMENDMQLRYNIYNQCVQQLQMAKAKVQERTPAFTVIKPATVPLKKDGPKRMTIIIAYIFAAFVFTSIYVLYKDASKKS